jgi:hypothetical protein
MLGEGNKVRVPDCRSGVNIRLVIVALFYI